MADLYVDVTAATDGTGTFSNPYNTIVGKTFTGNTMYFKRGQWIPVATERFIGANAVIDAYGDPNLPKPVLFATSARTNVMYAQGNNVFVNNVVIDAQNLCSYPFAWVLGGASISGGGGTNAEFRKGNEVGCFGQSDSGGTYTLSNLTFNDCKFYDNNDHGTIFVGNVSNIIYNRCIAYNNSLNSPSHGFSCRAFRTTFTSGWTLVSGTIYSRAETLPSYYVNTDFSTYPNPTQNIVTPTAPAVNEWGRSGGTLYVNIGTNLNSGVSVTVAQSVATGFQYNNCIAYGNQSTDAIEGTGIQLDDHVSNSTIQGCICYNNVGAGITSNRGDNNIIRGNLIYNNGRRGLNIQYSRGNTIQNNTIYKNDTIQNSGFEIAIDGGSTGNLVYNNIIVVDNKANGIQVGAQSVSGTTIQNNCIHGNTSSAIAGTTGTGTIAADPLLNTRFEPQNLRLQSGGVSVTGNDVYGTPFAASPSIGAVQMGRNGFNAIQKTSDTVGNAESYMGGERRKKKRKSP